MVHFLVDSFSNFGLLQVVLLQLNLSKDFVSSHLQYMDFYLLSQELPEDPC